MKSGPRYREMGHDVSSLGTGMPRCDRRPADGGPQPEGACLAGQTRRNAGPARRANKGVLNAGRDLRLQEAEPPDAATKPGGHYAPVTVSCDIGLGGLRTP